MEGCGNHLIRYVRVLVSFLAMYGVLKKGDEAYIDRARQVGVVKAITVLQQVTKIESFTPHYLLKTWDR